MMLTLAWGMPGGMEWVALLVIGLLLFGRRLPEVGRNVGRSIVEFRKGIKGIEDEIESESGNSGSAPAQRIEQPAAPTVAQNSPSTAEAEPIQGAGEAPSV